MRLLFSIVHLFDDHPIRQSKAGKALYAKVVFALAIICLPLTTQATHPSSSSVSVPASTPLAQIGSSMGMEGNQSAIILLSLFVILLLLILIALLTVVNRKRNQINKLLEKQRQDLSFANQELEEKNRLITRQNLNISKNNELISDVYNEHKSLVSVVAHDLKSPLNKIQGLTHILEMSGPLNDEQKEAVKRIHHVVEGGRGLISDLNSLIYFEDHDVRADFGQVELKPYICNLLGEHESYAWKKEIKLVFDKNDCDFTITTDEKFLTRILDNLLSNAIKFSYPKSTVHVACFRENGTYGIEVIDEGPGISKSDLNQLYKKFKRLSAQPTAGESSTGLGLSIVKTLVLKLQGDISVESEEGKGTKFTIVFPVSLEGLEANDVPKPEESRVAK